MTTLEPWNVVNKEIKRSTVSRVNWRAIFGMSLTKVIAIHRAKGHSVEQTLHILYDKPFMNAELRRRLRIGVNARFGEMDSEHNARKKIGVLCKTCGR